MSAMKPEFLREMNRLKLIFSSAGKKFPAVQGASGAQIDQIRKTTGIDLTGDLVDFYLQLDGSNDAGIFAVYSDEETTCEFLSVASALRIWRGSFADIDRYYSKINEQYEGYQQRTPRDLRIRQDLWANKLWFPFADFNGGGTRIFWDGDPSPAGNVGQIIVYQHDPDGIYYVAPDFLTFLKRSNDLFENNPGELLATADDQDGE